MSRDYLSKDAIDDLKKLNSIYPKAAVISEESADSLKNYSFIKEISEYKTDSNITCPYLVGYQISDRGRGFLDALDFENEQFRAIQEMAGHAQRIAISAEAFARQATENAERAHRLAEAADDFSRSAKAIAFEAKDGITVAKEAAEDARLESAYVWKRFWISTAISILALVISVITWIVR